MKTTPPEERAAAACEYLANTRGPRSAFVSIEVSQVIATQIHEAVAEAIRQDREAVLAWAADVVKSHAQAWTGQVRECYMEVEKQIRRGPT